MYLLYIYIIMKKSTNNIKKVFKDFKKARMVYTNAYLEYKTLDSKTREVISSKISTIESRSSVEIENEHHNCLTAICKT